MAPRLLPIFIGLIALLWSLPTTATSVLPVSLQRMSTAAELIFYGKVVSNEVKVDEISGRVATYTTFEVIEVIKGTVGTTHTIKQIGGEMPNSSRRQVIPGVPRFVINKEYVVFLPKASKLGFSSPIGLSQGKFTVQNIQGSTAVTNGRPVAALLNGDAAKKPQKTVRAPALNSLPGQPASTNLSDFLQTVRSMAGE